jgi:hypothetical protein
MLQLNILCIGDETGKNVGYACIFFQCRRFGRLLIMKGGRPAFELVDVIIIQAFDFVSLMVLPYIFLAVLSHNHISSNCCCQHIHIVLVRCAVLAS